MISYLDAAQKNATAYKLLLEYGRDTDPTRVALFSKVKDPDIIVIHVPGGVKALGLGMSGNNITSFQPDGFTWKLLNLWMNQNIAVATVDFSKKFSVLGSEMHPSKRTSEERLSVIEELIGDIRKTFTTSKIVGYGHSYGSLEMSELAKKNLLDKVAIGSGTWVTIETADGHPSVGINDLETNNPLLIVHHTDDISPRCDFVEAKKYMDRYEGITVTKGQPNLGNPSSDPGPHFFLSQENEVVRNIIKWARGLYYEKLID